MSRLAAQTTIGLTGRSLHRSWRGVRRGNLRASCWDFEDVQLFHRRYNYLFLDNQDKIQYKQIEKDIIKFWKFRITFLQTHLFACCHAKENPCSCGLLVTLVWWSQQSALWTGANCDQPGLLHVLDCPMLRQYRVDADRNVPVKKSYLNRVPTLQAEEHRLRSKFSSFGD